MSSSLDPSFLLCIGPSPQTDRKELSQANVPIVSMSLLIRMDCLKGNACFRVEFLKDFQIFGILSFEKSVEEMMLRACVYFWWLGFALHVWISLKGRSIPYTRGSSLWGEVAIGHGGARFAVCF